MKIESCRYLVFSNFETKYLISLSINKSLGIGFKEVNLENLEELKIEKSGSIVFLQCQIKKLKKLQIIESNFIEYYCNYYSIKELNMIKSNECKIMMESFKDKQIYIEDSEKIQFINSLKKEINPLSFENIELKDLHVMFESIFEYPFPKEIKKGKKIFKIRKFISKTNRIEINGNKIKRIKEITEEEVDMIVSNNFYTKTNEKEYFKYVNYENKIKTTKHLRYFEVEVKGISVVSIGIIHSTKYEAFEDNHVGWRNYSIGFHSDDGNIYNYNNVVKKTEIDYGNEEDVINVIGCGYYIDKHELFYTENGKFICSIPCKFESISVAIGIQNFNELSLNYGNEPFLYDFNDILRKNNNEKDDKCIVN